MDVFTKQTDLFVEPYFQDKRVMLRMDVIDGDSTSITEAHVWYINKSINYIHYMYIIDICGHPRKKTILEPLVVSKLFLEFPSS